MPYVPTIARVRGIKGISRVYGLLFSVHLVAIFSPMIAGYAYDFLGSFSVPFVALEILFIAAAFGIQRCRASFVVPPPD